MELAKVWELVIIVPIIVYIAVCFGLLAKRSGRNPWLWGTLSIISPINLFILGYWAIKRRLLFSGT